MMTITNYICDLLYRYDCVIVPDFGAFLTKRIAAHFSEDTHLMYPPQKQLSFNQQITNNDGLLANYIVSNEQVTYDKALEKIKTFVLQVKTELENKGRVTFSDIGFFNVNFENNLIFEPLHTSNYLPEAFGLSTLMSSSILRETLKEEVQALEEKAPIAFTPEKRKSSKFVKYAAAAAVALFLSGVGINAYKNHVVQHNVVEAIKAEALVEQEIQSASFVLDIPNPLPGISVKVKQFAEDSFEAETTPLQKYHIVAGAFREFENVDKKIKQLKRKGFSPKYIGENKYGLHQVIYSSHTSKNEAINALNAIKRHENSSAWLLVKK
ncbi:SPOR domain-containing protein [Aquimarina agarivorans]|uniref:HU domain-containing protein n=1 Tax=Aquimarina agarivorans TaxID=980584 RepID=UPI000248FCD8|nr:SPOR domain-containing protein [Aquimarina agarivorans]